VQVSYITRINTQAAATSTTVNTAIIPAGIFTPIAHSGPSAGASDSGSGPLTSSITVGQTSTMTSYQVGTSGTGSMDSGSNSTVAKPTQPAFHGAASNSFSFAGILASVIAIVAMVICL
jgi:cobalamin biosynthesis Mg chelatase CobN